MRSERGAFNRMSSWSGGRVKSTAALLLVFLMTSAWADAGSGVELKGDPKKVPAELVDVGVKEHLGSMVDLSLQFVSGEDGKTYPLSRFMDPSKPTLMNLVYFECPMLCTMVLNGVVEGMKGLDWTLGENYNMITLSIDPTETPEDAQAKKKAYFDHYVQGRTQIKTEQDRARALAHWNFLTGDEATIKKVADQLGFLYKYDEKQQEYAHPAVTFVLTPQGAISRYLYGVTYRPRDLRLALLEASQGKIGNVFDRLLMFCYHYDPLARGYSVQVFRVMQAGAAATIGLLGGWLLIFWTRQRKMKGKNANDNATA
jgi:protein SCO1/2